MTPSWPYTARTGTQGDRTVRQRDAASLLELGLIDELRVLVNPLILSEGRSLFSTLNKRVSRELWRTKTFRSGNVQLTDRPV